MPRPLSIALIAGLCFTCTARAEDKPSPAVKRILDKAVAKVRTNRTEFDKANKKPLDEARAELQELVTKLNKDGKTKEAIDTLRQVETLEDDVLKSANAPAPAPGNGGLAGSRKPLMETMEGRWDRVSCPVHYRFYKNGNAECVDDSTNQIRNQGRIALVSPEIAEIAWGDGVRERCVLAGDDLIVVLSWNPAGARDGDGFALERMK